MIFWHKNKQVGLHQTEKVSTAKETISKMQRQPTEWEKIYVSHISDKWLISKIHKKVIQLNRKKKKKQTNLKMGRRSGYTFFQRRHADGQQLHEKMLNIINHQRNANLTTMRYYLTTVRIAVTKKIRSKCWWGCGEKRTPVYSWWECKLLVVQPLWEAVWRFPYDPAIPLLIFTQRKRKH